MGEKMFVMVGFDKTCRLIGNNGEKNREMSNANENA